MKVVTIDDDYEALAARVPGFGGMFYDATGRLTVYLTDAGRRDVAVAALPQFLTEHHGRSAAPAARAVAGLRVLPGQYDFRQLRGWHRRILAARGRLPGITTTGISKRQNRVFL